MHIASYRFEVASYRLQVTGCQPSLPPSLPPSLKLWRSKKATAGKTGCRLQVAGCRLPAICQLPTANCQLPTANCQLPTANCQLPTANQRSLLPAPYFLPPAPHPEPSLRLPPAGYGWQSLRPFTEFTEETQRSTEEKKFEPVIFLTKIIVNFLLLLKNVS